MKIDGFEYRFIYVPDPPFEYGFGLDDPDCEYLNPDFPPGNKHFVWRDTVGDRTVSTIFLPVLGEYETAVLTKREGKPSRYSRFLRATDKEEARKNHVKTLKSLTG